MEKGILYTPSESFWTIPDVIYQGEIGTYRIFENLTPPMIQDKLAEFYMREKSKGNPYPTDAPLIWAIASRAYDISRENPENAERLRNFFQSGLEESPNTLSRVIYNFDGEEDEIVHNYGISDKYSLRGDIIGPDRKIISADEKTLELVLGNGDIKKINSVAQWINKTNFRIWRLHQKPLEKTERVVGFGAVSVSLDCDRYPRGRFSAFRVRIE